MLPKIYLNTRNKSRSVRRLRTSLRAAGVTGKFLTHTLQDVCADVYQRGYNRKSKRCSGRLNKRYADKCAIVKKHYKASTGNCVKRASLKRKKSSPKKSRKCHTTEFDADDERMIHIKIGTKSDCYSKYALSNMLNFGAEAPVIDDNGQPCFFESGSSFRVSARKIVFQGKPVWVIEKVFHFNAQENVDQFTLAKSTVGHIQVNGKRLSVYYAKSAKVIDGTNQAEQNLVARSLNDVAS